MPLRFAVRFIVVCGFGAFCLSSAASDRSRESGKRSASLICYDVPGGETLFALLLQADANDKSTPHDHVILIDTSASQAGAHRRQGLAVLDACLASLNAFDRVQLFAVDTQVKPFSNGFFGLQSAETKAALGELRRRVPLGATSLQPALDAALNSFAGPPGTPLKKGTVPVGSTGKLKEIHTSERDSPLFQQAVSRDRARSIIYIGDGMSTGKLVNVQEFRTLISQLRARHIPVNSFAVGPRTDLQVLGILAQHTGGVVIVDALADDARQTPEKLGQKLAAAADAAVFYPESISLAPEGPRLLPGSAPPLRADRETILLGKGRVGQSLTVTAAGNKGSYTWSVKPSPAQAGNTFLAGLWNIAEQSDGLLVAVAGNELLNAARQEYEDQVEELRWRRGGRPLPAGT